MGQSTGKRTLCILVLSGVYAFGWRSEGEGMNVFDCVFLKCGSLAPFLRFLSILRIYNAIDVINVDLLSGAPVF